MPKRRKPSDIVLDLREKSKQLLIPSGYPILEIARFTFRGMDPKLEEIFLDAIKKLGGNV